MGHDKGEGVSPSEGLSLYLPGEQLDLLAQKVANATLAGLRSEGAVSADGWLTAAEAAQLIHGTRRRIYDQHAQGKLEGRKDGRRLLISRRSLECYLGGTLLVLALAVGTHRVGVSHHQHQYRCESTRAARHELEWAAARV